MPDPRRDDAYATELLRRQDALQAEARQVIDALNLTAHLARAGRLEHIGSSAMGLMVWRDLDLGVIGPGMNAERAFEAMRPIVTHPRTVELAYTNECGPRSPTDSGLDDRFYFVVRYETPAGENWKIDISFWALDAPRRQLAHVEELRRRLTDETRRVILWIKDVWHRLPVYPYEVGGTDVYEAVLEHGVRTPDEFDAYLRARGLPSRS